MASEESPDGDECETCGGTGIAPVLYNAREPCKDCSDYAEGEQ